ncbi:MAG: hypothetical protein KZQ86_20900 [Candidatus Thiodiazotropha sp. (ex Lucinoma kastoroae)]|nr:hypothetical protein [Candidatus Thiodiazotropha sp. (ex Lucinoma kastoroae)]
MRRARRGEMGNDGQEGIDKPSAAFRALARVFEFILERGEDIVWNEHMAVLFLLYISTGYRRNYSRFDALIQP